MTTFTIGGRYNWKNQPERLVHLGRNWSGNGYWNQFALVDAPDKVWCEVTDEDLQLHMLEPTMPDLNALEQRVLVIGGAGYSSAGIEHLLRMEHGPVSPTGRAAPAPQFQPLPATPAQIERALWNKAVDAKKKERK